MKTVTEIANQIKTAERPVFMTGAGVSTASGIPDYRSMTGIYTQTGLKEPEYLLSHRAMLNDTENFYAFIKQLYHPEALPNVIHQAMAKVPNATVISQNIDGLHRAAGSNQLIEFHGSLATCHCEKCGQTASSQEFLKSYRHDGCGGILRPDIVLYDEQIDMNNIANAITALKKTDLVVIVGTSFKVYPFAALINHANPAAKIIAINREPVAVPNLDELYLGNAEEIFKLF